MGGGSLRDVFCGGIGDEEDELFVDLLLDMKVVRDESKEERQMPTGW